MAYFINVLDKQGHFELIDGDLAVLYPDLDFEKLTTLSDAQYKAFNELNGREDLRFIDGDFVARPVKPSTYHKWDGKKWTITKANQTALLTQQKEALITQLAEKTDRLKSSLLVGYPQTEIDSFYRQEKEALAYQADNSAETPMLKQIAELRGVPFEILVQKVIEKSNQFALVIGAIIGQRQKFEDRILSATSETDLDTIKTEVNQWQLQNQS